MLKRNSYEMKYRDKWLLRVNLSKHQPEIDGFFRLQPSIRANANAVTDEQHADHRRRIDRGAASIVVDGNELSAQPINNWNPISTTLQMIFWNQFFQ
jgi:hypothetical protein